MKFKIKQIGEKTFDKKDGSGKITILTVLTEEDKKIKAWKSNYTDTYFKMGAEIEVETEVKKDRDGFDEIWIKAPKGAGKNFVRNTAPEAYTVAIQWMIASGKEMTPEELDTQAAYFQEKFKMLNPTKIEQPKGEANPNNVPF